MSLADPQKRGNIRFVTADGGMTAREIEKLMDHARKHFSFRDCGHARSPKNLSKNGFCARKGVAFLWKAFLQKFLGAGEDCDQTGA
jgi:hypothetical protein